MFDQVTLNSLYLDHILLAPICTLCSTCHEFNESFVYVRVFQDTSAYGASASQVLELDVSEFCYYS